MKNQPSKPTLAGRIANGSAMQVQALYPQQIAKQPTVRRGGDLRQGTKRG